MPVHIIVELTEAELRIARLNLVDKSKSLTSPTEQTRVILLSLASSHWSECRLVNPMKTSEFIQTEVTRVLRTFSEDLSTSVLSILVPLTLSLPDRAVLIQLLCCGSVVPASLHLRDALTASLVFENIFEGLVRVVEISLDSTRILTVNNLLPSLSSLVVTRRVSLQTLRTSLAELVRPINTRKRFLKAVTETSEVKESFCLHEALAQFDQFLRDIEGSPSLSIRPEDASSTRLIRRTLTIGCKDFALSIRASDGYHVLTEILFGGNDLSFLSELNLKQALQYAIKQDSRELSLFFTGNVISLLPGFSDSLQKQCGLDVRILNKPYSAISGQLVLCQTESFHRFGITPQSLQVEGLARCLAKCTYGY